MGDVEYVEVPPGGAAAEESMDVDASSEVRSKPLQSASTSSKAAEINDTRSAHIKLYKQPARSCISQEERRRKYLEAQRCMSRDRLLQMRNINAGLASAETSDSASEVLSVDLETADESVVPCDNSPVAQDEAMADQPIAITISTEDGHKGPYIREQYANRFMKGEWLLEVPYDFAENWFMVPCPRGKRCFVAAEGGSTSAYSKEGKRIVHFMSDLPGGRRDSRSGHTYLDSLFCSKERTFYLLDILCWNSNEVAESETEFRFQWLDWKLAETSWNSHCPYRFVRLPVFACSREAIESALRTKPWPFPADRLNGLLFYHKNGHYYAGTTPLVGWLLPFMCRELLNVEVPDEYMAAFENVSVTGYLEQWKATDGRK